MNSTEYFELIVVGGGASGLGVALDAQTRGASVLLLEQGDFAQATSSRSTKLIHGGVRYLRQGHIGLVRESLLERSRLVQNAPGLVAPLPFVLPTYRVGETAWYGLGLKLYDALAGRHRLQGSSRLNRSRVGDLLPTLRRDTLRGGCLYYDAQFDDAALAFSLVRSIRQAGGQARNYHRVVGLRFEEGQVSGVTVEDLRHGSQHEIRAKTVVNATGIFSDGLRRLAEPDAATTVTHSRGSHLVLPRWVLPGEHALMIPKTVDKRVLFAIPWNGVVLFGTTDVAVDSAHLEPEATVEEVDYLLRYARLYLDVAIASSDILACFAGLRPLVRPEQVTGGTSAISREHVVRTSDNGLVSVQGGKWTTYRKMAEDVMDQLMPGKPSTTADLQLVERLPDAWPLDRSQVETIVAEGDVCHLDDVLSRRSRWLLQDVRGCMAAAPDIAGWMAEALGEDADWQAEELDRFMRLAQGYLPPDERRR